MTIIRAVGPRVSPAFARRLVPASSSLAKRISPPAKKVIVRRPVAARQPNVVVHKQSNGIKFRNADVKDKFNPAMLDLGNLNTPCEEKNAFAAVFDLTDFTRFCNQVDAYLEIPRFLNHFLTWFFSCQIRFFSIVSAKLL